jgi:elongation factor G
MANPSDLRPMVGEDANGNKVERHTSDDEPFSAFVFKTVVDPYSGVSSIFKIYSGTIKAGDEIFIPEIKKNLTVSQLFTVLGGKTVAVQELHAGDMGCITKVEGLETSMTICNPKNVVVYPKIDFPSPVYYKALVPKTKQDEDKLSMILKRIEAEDKSIEERHNREAPCFR